jgi:hypothetical protein
MLPFTVWEASGTAFLNEPLLATDISIAPEYLAAFEFFGTNVFSMNAMSPDSFLFGATDGGGTSLAAGGPYTHTVTMNFRDQEGIVRIDSERLPPANDLNFWADDPGGLITVTPTFSPGCFPVTIGPPCSVTLTGDANESEDLTSADVIWLVAYTFKNGAPPEPCIATGDVNCDGAVTASDLIFLVNTIFKGGPLPCDVCTLSPNTWTCP